jgi:hypothetical protein
VFLALMSAGGLIAPYLTGRILDAAASPAAGYATAFQVFGIAALVASVVAPAHRQPGTRRPTSAGMRTTDRMLPPLSLEVAANSGSRPTSRQISYLTPAYKR